MKSGTPSVLVTICSSTSGGSALPPATRADQLRRLAPADAVQGQRRHLRAPGPLVAGSRAGTSPGRRQRDAATRSMQRPRSSRVVGSIQWASSTSSSTGRLPPVSISATSASSRLLLLLRRQRRAAEWRSRRVWRAAPPSSGTASAAVAEDPPGEAPRAWRASPRRGRPRRMPAGAARDGRSPAGAALLTWKGEHW